MGRSLVALTLWVINSIDLPNLGVLPLPRAPVFAGSRQYRQPQRARARGCPLELAVVDAQSVPESRFWPSDSLVRGIHRRSETEFRIDERSVEEIFANGKRLLRGLVLFDGKRSDGVLLREVRLDSLWERLGLLTGDELLAINGVPVDTAHAALDELVRARGQAWFRARLRRSGEVFELTIEVIQENAPRS